MPAQRLLKSARVVMASAMLPSGHANPSQPSSSPASAASSSGPCPSRRARSTDQAFELKPCQTGRGAPAECGLLSVPENRATGQGRRIGINVIVLRATSPGAKIALFLLAGGPGSGQHVDERHGDGMDGAAARDDGRRPHGSAGDRWVPIRSPVKRISPRDPARAFGHIRDPEVIRKCVSALQTRADLSQYTTDVAVADMEEIRVKLGYDAIALYGGSCTARASHRRICAAIRTARARWSSTACCRSTSADRSAMRAASTVPSTGCWPTAAPRPRASRRIRIWPPSLRRS